MTFQQSASASQYGFLTHRHLSELSVFLLSLLFFILSLSANLSIAHDSIYYLNEIEWHSPGYFHPHHLLYHELGAIWLMIRPPGIAAIYWLESLNAIAGASLLTLCFRFMRIRLHIPSPMAYWGVVLVGSSYGIWAYSIVIEVYIIPLFFLLLSLYWLSSATISVYQLIGAAIAWAIAILFHQSHILFSPAAITILVLNCDRSHLFRSTMSFLGLAATIVMGTYTSTIIWGLSLPPEEIYNWLLGYAQEDTFWNPPSLESLAKIFIGFGRSLIGFHGVFRLEIPGLADSHQFVAERFLVERMPYALAMGLCVLPITIVLLIGNGCYRIYRNFQLVRRQQPVIPGLIVAFVAYSLFFSFWVPVNQEFWIPQLLFCWLIWLSLIHQVHIRVDWRIRLLACSLILVNLCGSIYWFQKPEYDYYQTHARAIAAHTQAQDLLITASNWRNGPFYRRYVSCNIFDLSAQDPLTDSALLKSIKTEISKCPGNVWVSNELSPWQTSVLGPQPANLTSWNSFWKRCQTTARRYHYDTGYIYLVQNGCDIPAN